MYKDISKEQVIKVLAWFFLTGTLVVYMIFPDPEHELFLKLHAPLIFTSSALFIPVYVWSYRRSKKAEDYLSDLMWIMRFLMMIASVVGLFVFEFMGS